MMNDLCKRYNQVLTRVHRAEDFLNDHNIDITEKEPWIEEYKCLCNELGSLLDKIKFYEKHNVLSGFKDAVQESFA